MRAAQGTGVKVIKRKVFLAIRKMKRTSVCNSIAQLTWHSQRFDHCHWASSPFHGTRVTQMVYNLPPDITLVKASSLLMNRRLIRLHRRKTLCPTHRVSVPWREALQTEETAGTCLCYRFFEVLSESISQSTLIVYFRISGKAGASSPKRQNLTLAQLKALRVMRWCDRVLSRHCHNGKTTVTPDNPPSRCAHW